MNVVYFFCSYYTMFGLKDSEVLSVGDIDMNSVEKTVEHLKIAKMLTALAIVISAFLSLGGIFFNIYRDNQLITAVWQGNDIVTLLVAVPMLIWVLLRLKSPSQTQPRETMIWLGGLWYLIYNYVFYVYGAFFNIFFLGYIAVVILSVSAMFFGLIHASTYVERFRNIRTSFKSISNFMFGFAALLGLAWTFMAASFWFTQVVPIAITQTGHPTGVIFATDLIFLVFPLFLTAGFLRKGSPWAMLVTPIIMVKCCLYPLVFMAAGVLAYLKTGIYDALTPIYLMLGLGCAWVLRVMLARLK